MKTKPPFNLKDDTSTKLEVLEKRIRDWMNKKSDILGIDTDAELRDKLFDIDMAIFMNQFLYRTMYWDKLHSTLESAMSSSIKKSKT
jgi:hypothetical protein